MNWVTFWTAFGAIGALLALVGVVFGIRSYYRDHPRRSLEYTVNCRRLVQPTGSAELEIRVDGVEVPDPYLVEFRLVSNSRADIPSNSFDGGRSITVRMEKGSPYVLGDTSTRGNIEVGGIPEGAGWEWGEFRIAPQLIRRNALLAIDFIFNEEPEIVVESHLIDIPIINVSERRNKRNEVMLHVANQALQMVAPFRLPDSRNLLKGDSKRAADVTMIRGPRP